MMVDRKDKRYVSCPVCGKILMKCQGQCNVEITCSKCNREIVALIDEERVMVLENRRGVARTHEPVKFELASRKLRVRRWCQSKRL